MRSYFFRTRRRNIATGLAVAAVGLAVVAVLVGSQLMRPAAPPSGSPSMIQVSPPPSQVAAASRAPVAAASPSPTAAASRYPGGIPTSLDGEPVYLGLGAVLHADATKDATPFLVGGWFGDGGPYTCTGGIVLGTPDPALFHGCGGVGGDSPWGVFSSPGPQGWLAWNGHSLPGDAGPSIVRVHAHDPLSAQCSAVSRASCEAMLIVDDVLWTGDPLTRASPISVADAVDSLDAILIRGLVTMPEGPVTVTQHVYPTVRRQPCPSPWPIEVFDLHGDPRFAMLAVFPDEAARVAGQPLLDSSADACPTDPGVVRPGSRLWVGQANVLVLVYGSDAADATRKALSTATSPTQTYRAIIGFPAANVDESYRVVVDFLATRESGNVENRPLAGPAVQPPVSKGADAVAANYAAYVADAKRRYLANALSFSVGPARTPAEADVGTAEWNVLTSNAVPGTARLFEVDHPGSTVPALRHEVYVAYQYKNPSAASWTLLLVDAEPWPSES